MDKTITIEFDDGFHDRLKEAAELAVIAQVKDFARDALKHVARELVNKEVERYSMGALVRAEMPGLVSKILEEICRNSNIAMQEFEIAKGKLEAEKFTQDVRDVFTRK